MRYASRLTMTAGGLLALAFAASGCAGRSAPQAVGGAENFVLTTTSSAADPVYQVRASGAFAAKGTFASVRTGPDESMVRFPGGTFIMTHPLSSVRFTVQSLNKHSCAAVLERTGTFTLSSGTGAYAGITGYGTDAARFSATLPRRADGKCAVSGKALRKAVSAGPAGLAAPVIRTTGSLVIPPKAS
jgi:hypothetical protein